MKVEMKKTHYPDPHPPKSYITGQDLHLTLCGEVYRKDVDDVSSDISQITCKRCLKVLEKERREKRKVEEI